MHSSSHQHYYPHTFPYFNMPLSHTSRGSPSMQYFNILFSSILYSLNILFMEISLICLAPHSHHATHSHLVLLWYQPFFHTLVQQKKDSCVHPHATCMRHQMTPLHSSKKSFIHIKDLNNRNLQNCLFIKRSIICRLCFSISTPSMLQRYQIQMQGVHQKEV